MFFGLGAYTPLLFYTLWGWPPIAGIPAGILLSIGLSISAWRRSQSPELIRIFTGTWDFVGAAI
jgi:branched-chain amino acid transport system permease protein